MKPFPLKFYSWRLHPLDKGCEETKLEQAIATNPRHSSASISFCRQLPCLSCFTLLGNLLQKHGERSDCARKPSKETEEAANDVQLRHLQQASDHNWIPFHLSMKLGLCFESVDLPSVIKKSQIFIGAAMEYPTCHMVTTTTAHASMSPCSCFPAHQQQNQSLQLH